MATTLPVTTAEASTMVSTAPVTDTLLTARDTPPTVAVNCDAAGAARIARSKVMVMLALALVAPITVSRGAWRTTAPGRPAQLHHVRRIGNEAIVPPTCWSCWSWRRTCSREPWPAGRPGSRCAALHARTGAVPAPRWTPDRQPR